MRLFTKTLLLISLFLTSCTPVTQVPLKPVAQAPSMTVVCNNIVNESVIVIGRGTLGTGVIVTRGKTSYVWTVAHVLEGLIETKVETDKDGVTHIVQKVKGDAKIIKHIFKNGEAVEQIVADGEIVRYDKAADLAIIRIKGGVFDSNCDFHVSFVPPELGTSLIHLGHYRGMGGSYTLSTGIISYTTRRYFEQIYDQTTTTATQGCSGGGVFLQNGECVGLMDRVISIDLVNGAGGDNANFIIPVRYMMLWAIKNNCLFLIDKSLPIPEGELVLN